MARSIKVTWSVSRYRVNRDDGIRVRIELTENEGVPLELFAYRIAPENGDTVATFSHICSPADIEEFPANTASSTAVPPWFRLAYVDLLLRSTAEVDNIIAIVQEDIQRLLATLKRMETLVPTGDIVLTA